MVMGPINQGTVEARSRTAWLGRCVSRLLLRHRQLKQDMSASAAHEEAQQLWMACGLTLSPEEAADQWMYLEQPCDAVYRVIHMEMGRQQIPRF